jgi:hypothetical protein
LHFGIVASKEILVGFGKEHICHDINISLHQTTSRGATNGVCLLEYLSWEG